MLDNTASDIKSSTYMFAPGKGYIPVFSEPLAEFISFPIIFCGKVRPSNDESLQKVYTSEIFKY